MRQSKRKQKNDQSIFELISDISLSTLGLFLIFFVVYSLIFNSRDFELRNQVKNIEIEMTKLNQQIVILNEEKTQLNEALKRANDQAINAEREKQLALQRNQYTGYYSAKTKVQINLSGCNQPNIATLEGEQSIFYIQESNTVIHLTSYPGYGTITDRYNGSIQGNTFSGKITEYLRTDGIIKCDSSNDIQIIINFFDNRLEFYYSNSYPNGEKTTLNKIN